MGLKDRDYMQPGYRPEKAPGTHVPLKNRLLFFLYRIKRALCGRG